MPGESDIHKITRLYIMYCFDYNLVRLTDHTITELKTSGDMRLIKNKSVANSILSYDDLIHNTEKQGDITLAYGEKNVEYGNSILNMQQLMPFIKKGPSVFLDKKVKTLNDFAENPEPKLVLQFANSLELYTGICNDYILQLSGTKKETIKLIDLIKKEYNLK